MVVPFLFTLESVGEGPPNLNKTLEVQQQLVNEQPYSAEVHNDLGNLLVLSGRSVEAEAAYGRALELDPINTSARFNLGLLMQQDGRLKEALQAFKTVMKADASHAWATYQAGVVLDERGKRRGALEHYARAFALDSSLTFANTNPHIIDNQLATEALLLSKNFTVNADRGRMPRLYGEPERIVGLMLDDGEKEHQDTEDANDEEDVLGEALQENHRLHPRAVESEGDGLPEDQPSLANRNDEDEDEDNGKAVQPRRPGAVQVLGGRAGSTATAAPAERGRGRDRETQATRRGGQPGRGATVTGGGAQREETIPNQSPNRSRYRPATTSSGRLEMELLPEEEPERVTR